MAAGIHMSPERKCGVMRLLIHSHGLEVEGFVVNKRVYCLGSIDGRELILEKQATPSLNPVLFI